MLKFKNKTLLTAMLAFSLSGLLWAQEAQEEKAPELVEFPAELSERLSLLSEEQLTYLSTPANTRRPSSFDPTREAGPIALPRGVLTFADKVAHKPSKRL